MHFDLDILLYILVAVVVIGRLWSVLGTRNEDDPQRPNPFVPPTPKPDASVAALPPSPLLLPVLPPASLAGGLAQVKAIDTTFDEKQFLQEARADFTLIVESYARADMGSIAALLAPPLLAHFQNAADARKQAGQTAQTRILKIKDADPIEAHATDAQAFITVKFVSNQENILRDTRGTIIGGTEGKSEEITDIWTFSRDTQVTDAKWIVMETRG